MSAPVTQTRPALPPLDDDLRETLAATPRSVAAHDALMAAIPAMMAVETGGTPAEASRPLALPLTVAAWNIERGLFPEASAALLAATGAGLVLLSEADCGMARTGQRHVTAEIADRLGMGYAYGVEFFELGLGQDTELRFCTDDRNALGFHGNALMARTALARPFLLRLAGRRQWFTDAGDQPRLGERMAIGAVIETVAGPLVAVSTHLESNALPEHRAAQVAGLIEMLDRDFAGLPVVIGGDLNTGNFPGGDWSDETLFDIARAHGFAVHGGPEGRMTTRPSLITRWPDRAMRLDWFLTRGVEAGGVDAGGVDAGGMASGGVAVIDALDPTGQPLSDHELITLRIEGLTAAVA